MVDSWTVQRVRETIQTILGNKPVENSTPDQDDPSFELLLYKQDKYQISVLGLPATYNLVC
jgi:hypothetical protein